MKGILADRPVGIKVFTLFLLAVFGALFFTSLGMLLASAKYSLSYDQVAEILSELSLSENTSVFQMVQGFATLGAFLFPALAGAYLFSKQPENFLRINHFPRPAGLIILAVALLSYSSGMVSDLLFRFSTGINWPESMGWWESYLRESQDTISQQYQAILQMHSLRDFFQVLMIMALLPAVAEEALFRGAVQPLLVKALGKHGGILITALAFALLHQQALAFLSIFALGLLLGYLRQWSGSLWVPTLMHFINNGLIVVLVYFFEVPYQDAAEGTLFDDWATIALSGVIFVFSLLFTFYLLHRRGQQPEI